MIELLWNNPPAFCTSSYGALIFCAIIVAFFLASLIYFWYAQHKVKLRVKEILRVIFSVKDQKEFYIRFDELDSQFKANPFISRDWQRFSRSMIFPEDQSTNPGIIRTTTSAHQFFEPQAFLARKLNLSLLNAIPNYLTGGGIFFTFIGLAAGIYQAQSGFNTNDSAKVTHSLQSLLGGASLAFWTSIVGLFCSILFSFLMKWRVNRLPQLFNQLNSHLDHLVPLVTPERIAYEQLGELKIQSGQLQRFNTELAVSIAEALESRLSSRLNLLVDTIEQALSKLVNENLGPQLDNIQRTLEGIKADRGEALGAMLQQIVEKFQESLLGAAGKEFQDLAGVVSELAVTINASHPVMKQAQEHLGKAFDEMRERTVAGLQEIISTIKESSKKTAGDFENTANYMSSQLTKAGRELEETFQHGVERIEKTFDRFQNLAEQMQSAVNLPLISLKELLAQLSINTDNLKAAAQESLEILSKTEDAARALAAIPKGIEAAVTPITNIAEKFATAGQEVSHAARRSQETHEEMKAFFKTLRDEREALTKFWEQYQGRFADLDETLKKVFEEIDEGLTAYATRLRDYVMDLDKYMGEGAEFLGGAVGEMREFLEELNDLVARLKK